ncbi:MAG TPA: aromatic amino acid ammonia-lyase [Chryseosolibacter sp.]|nr:aromatic amino acid ammonia-lyase [Chryseosolibacter sp.]
MVILGAKKLDATDFESVVFDRSEVSVDDNTYRSVRENFDFLQSYSKDKVIYGINTGLGPMAQFKIKEEDQHQLQYNLIRSHSAGAGPLFSAELARATMLARLNSLVQARSGIHPSALTVISSLLNKNILPSIFERGGVGASGDLVQLAHLALNMVGEGSVIFDGQSRKASDVFKEQGVEPLKIHLREGLALMNGTSAMTGVGFVNLLHASYLLNCCVILSSIINELMKSFDDHFSLELNQVKHHPGQNIIAAQMRELLNDSKLVRKRPEHLYHRKITEAVFTDKVQEYYSLRCIPQILGPVYDTIMEVKEVLENEVNSVNDNPVVDHHRQNVYHGGNFHGDYVSFAMDKLKIAIVKLSMLSERQLNYLLNDKLNQKLPSFINLGTLGLNFGLQGMQFMATSTVAENQTLANPMYIHSIPSNNDNQDIVSMGCNAALLTRRVIQNSFDVLAVQLIALAQAIDFLKYQPRLSSFTLKIYEEVRALSPVILEDQPRHEDIKKISTYLFTLGRSAQLHHTKFRK